jgi:hypothetical protein
LRTAIENNASEAARAESVAVERNMRNAVVKKTRSRAARVRFLPLIVGLVAALNHGASAEPGPLVGKMAWWQKVVGAWVCEVRFKPTQGQPGQTWITIAKGSVAPGNVFHFSESAPGLETDQYDGYSARQKSWWETQANSFGYATLLQSSDNRLYVQISVPPPFEDDRNKYRETYELKTDGRLYTTAERQVNGAWVPDTVSSCRKMQSTPPV